MDMKTFTGLLAPKDVQPYQFSRKDNIHGIGYSGIDPAMAMFGGINREEKPFRPTGVEKKGIKGQVRLICVAFSVFVCCKRCISA